MDKDKIQRQILEAYPGTIPDMDIDWDMGKIFFKAGIKEVVEWVNKNCLGCQSNTPSNTDEYLGFHKKSWQAFLTGKGIKEAK